MTTRATDGGPLSAAWGRWGRDAVTVLAVLIAGFAVLKSDSEATSRIDATCTIWEQKQRSDVDRLAQTYRYLGDLTPRQMAQPLNRAVLAGLPTTIRDAQIDDAPGYCKEDGVGLDGPDPDLPKRPPNLPAG